MANRLSSEAREAAHFRVLDEIARHPQYSQRQLSKAVGVSVGRINYCLKALFEEGLVKADHFRKSSNKRDFVLVLTPTGVTERARMAHRFLQRKLTEYDALTSEIAALREQLDQAPNN